MFSWNQLDKPVVALAPMADMTDSAFCRICKKNGCEVVFREMVSAEAMVRSNEKTLSMTFFHDEERPIVQQIFGSNSNVMAEATRIIDETRQPEAFDVNMGCPAYKIIGNFNGASLMREPERAADIIKSMKRATDKPVSAKMRLGWSDRREILEFVQIVEAAGADLISIHGRTKEQAYGGDADWEMIARARERVSIPMLANGDIFSPELAVKALEVTGCDGILIARGALGNPWIFSDIKQALAEQDDQAPERAERSIKEKTATVLDHAKLHAKLHDGDRPMVTFRKHLIQYFKGMKGAKALREKLVTVETLEDLEAVLEKIESHG